MLVVKLGKAGGHLAAAGAGCGDDHERPGGFDVFVFAVALVADDVLHVRRVACDGIVPVDRYAKGRKAALEGIRGALAAVLREHDAPHVKADGAERVDEAQHVLVVGDAEVAAHLVLFDVRRVDDDHDLCLFLELEQHLHLAVRRKTGQHARGVVIVEQLAAELKVQLAAELGDALPDVLRLHGEILAVVKTDVHGGVSPFSQVKIEI